MGKIVVFGATGFTGRLTVAALVRRGIRPIIAGRSRSKLRALADREGGLTTRVADVEDPASLRRLLARGDVLITTVGPFSRLGEPVVAAAIEAGAHYLDSTGEPAFIRRVFQDHDGPARARGVTLLTAFGYDYVPGNLAAAIALEEVGERAERVDVGYFVFGEGGFAMSEGTAASSALAMLEPGVVFQGGVLREQFGGRRLRRFPVGPRRRPAISVPGSEHIALPRSYPWLREVNVYIGWFGAASYVMAPLSRVQAALFRIPRVKRLAAARLQQTSDGRGPGVAAREASGSHIVAQALAGREVLSTVQLVGANAYDYTAELLAWGAESLSRGACARVGALGPVEAFGLPALLDGSERAGLRVAL